MKAIALVLLLPFVPTRAIDGDTLVGVVVYRPGLAEQLHVRLDCLSTPELRADGGGVAETRRLAEWLAGDGGYTLRTSWAHDKYGRLLGEPLRDGVGYCR